MSIFLIEKIPVEDLNLLKRLNVDEYMRLNKKNKDYTNAEVKQHFNIITNYIDNHLKNGGIVEKEYKQKNGKGRFYGADSIQGIDGKVRGFLYSSNTLDLDIKNCHPTILNYICFKKNINCPCLNDYIINRDFYISKIPGVKMDIIKLLNSNDDFYIKKDFKGFYKKIKGEFNFINKILRRDEEFKDFLKDAEKEKPHNINGSFINRVITESENEILMIMKKYFDDRNIKIASLAFDGLLIYSLEIEENLILDLQNTINNIYDGLNVKLSIKPHDKTINKEYLLTLPEYDETRTYMYMKKKFELSHCKIIRGANYAEFNGDEIHLMNENDLIKSFKHLNFYEKNKKKSFIKEWISDDEINIYDNMEMIPPPLVCPKETFNLWRPFKMELKQEYIKKDIEPILNHIKILCNHEEPIYKYVIEWIAQMIQYPAIKTTLILFSSDEGAGKGSLLELIKNMVGSKKYLETTTPERDIWGGFNSPMMNSFFCHISELSQKATTEAEGKIKGLITDGDLKINQKGINQVSITSYNRFIVATNEAEPMKTHKGDRRKLMISSSNEKKGDSEYFINLKKIINDDDYIKSFYEYLKAIPNLENFHTLPIPRTEYQSLLCELTLSPIEHFIKDLTDKYNKNMEVSNDDLFIMFNDFLTESKIKFEINKIKFFVRLDKLKIPGIESTKKKGNRIKKINIEEVKKHYGLNCLIE